MDWSLILSVVSVITSTGVAILVFIEKKSSDRQSTCFRLHEMWNSPYMQECRKTVWTWLEKNRFDREAIKNQAPDIDAKLGTIEHFIADVHTLMQAGMLDKSMTKELFWSIFQQWFEHFDKADWGEGRDGKFYRERIKPIKAEMERIG